MNENLTELKQLIEALIRKMNAIKEQYGCEDGEVILEKQDNGIVLVKAREKVVHYFFNEQELNTWALE